MEIKILKFKHSGMSEHLEACGYGLTFLQDAVSRTQRTSQLKLDALHCLVA
jgi:hypothetical protein